MNKKQQETKEWVEARIEELKKTKDLYHNDAAMQELLLLRGIKQAPTFRVEAEDSEFFKALGKAQQEIDSEIKPKNIDPLEL